MPLPCITSKKNNKQQQKKKMSSSSSLLLETTTDRDDELRVCGLILLGKKVSQIQKQSRKMQDRFFRAHYSARWATVSYLWHKLLKVDAKTGEKKLEMRHLLWCLHFLKLYCTEDVGASQMKSLSLIHI